MHPQAAHAPGPAAVATPSVVPPAAALPSWPESINPTAPGASVAAADYHRWAQGQRSGRLYGKPDGTAPAQMTTALTSGNSLETSGSLTGHILSQGRGEAPAPRRNVAKVGLVLAVGLGILVGVGVLVVLFIGDSFTNVFGGLLE